MQEKTKGYVKFDRTPTKGAIQSLANAINSLDGTKKRKYERKKPEDDKGKPAYYQKLIEYYFRRRGEVDKGWRFCEDEYNSGRGVDENAYEIQEVKPSRAFAITSNVEALVLGQRPRIFARGFTSEREQVMARVLEQAVNNEWQQDSKLLKETRLCVRDCTKFGFGVMLTSYEEDSFDPAARTKEAEDRKAMTVDDPMIAQADVIGRTEEAELEVRAETPEAEYTFEQDDRVVKRKVASRRVSPWQFIADPTATSEDNWKWVGRVFICDLDSVKKDASLKNTAGLKPSASKTSHAQEGHLKKIIEAYSKEKNGFPYDIIVMYEIFVRNPDGSWSLKLMADGHDKFLREVDDPYWIGQPYRMLRWNEDGENLFPQSDIQIVASEIVAERMLYTKALEGYSREQSDTTLIDASLGITTENFNAVEDPDIGKIIIMQRDATTASVPLQNFIMKLPKDQKSPEMLNFMAAIEKSIQVSTGLSNNQFGQAMKSGTTATEAAEVGGMARGRAAHKFSAVEEFIAGIAHDRIGIMCQAYTESDIYRLAGKEAAEAWSEAVWTKGDVQNGIYFIVEPGSTKRVSEQGRVQALMNMVGIINADPGLKQQYDTNAIINDIFRNLGEFHPEKYQFEKDGLAAAQQRAALEAELAAQGTGAPVGQAGGSPEQVFTGNEAQGAGVPLQ